MPDFGTDLNRIFVENLQDPAMRKEAEEKSMAYLKMRIYEDSVAQRIIPEIPISRTQCDRSDSGPTELRKVIDKEFTDVTATVMDFRGKGDYKFVDNDTYAIDFHKIESEEYHITEGELRAKEQPIQQLIKHHTSKEIEATIDQTFFKGVEAILTAAGGAQTITTSDSVMLPDHIKTLRNLLDGRTSMPLEAATLVMTKARFNDIDTWQQHGVDNGMGSEFWKDGYKYDRLFDLRVVKTIKADIVSNDTVYVFVDPQYLGHHYTFQDDRFQIRTEWDDIAWKAWKTHGMAIGNNYGVAKIVFNS